MTEALSTIVLDNGTGTCKAGFAGNDAPTIVGRCAVGHAANTDPTQIKYCIGHELAANRSNAFITYPMHRGIVTDWDDMQRFWNYIFLNELKADTSAHSLLITEEPLNPKANRETMAEMMYEVFNIPAICVSMPSVMTLYSLARTSGLVIDSGEGVTTVVPIQEGYALPHAIKRSNIAGRDLTNYMQELMSQRDVVLAANDKDEIFREIKESLCYVKPKAVCALSGCSTLMASYELPDGAVVEVGLERYRCPEALFNPPIMGVEAEGIQDLAYNSVMKCDTDIRRNLFGNVLLAGGTMTLPGIDSRLQADISELAPGNVKVGIVPTNDRSESAWVGGSILASLSLFTRMCITKKEYEESGPSIMHTIC